MLAAWYEQQGAPHDVLKLGDLPQPEPQHGEVRVRVQMSAVNPSDTKQRSGWGGYTSMPFERIVPHNDGSGVIDAIGSGVPSGRIGERVWVYEAQRDGRAFGTAAEWVVVPSANAVQLPDNASFEDGASLGVPGMTAHRLLFSNGAIQGQTIFIAGGAGSVGHLAVQLARWAGAQVIASVGSDEQGTVALECGAHHVVNYKQDDVQSVVSALLGKTDAIDRVIEVAFAKNVELDAKLLKPNGTIATYMIDELDPRPALSLQPLLVKGITVHFTLVYAMSLEAHTKAIKDLTAALRQGALKPRIAGRFRLDQIADVHLQLGTGGMGGKALLHIQNL